MEHGHPGSSTDSISGGAEQEVLLDGHVADERQDEQRHAEHDEPQRADYAHHPASLRAPAPPDQRITDGPGRGDGERPGASHPRQSEGVDAKTTRTSNRFQGSWGGPEDRDAEMRKARQINKDAQRVHMRSRSEEREAAILQPFS